MGGYGKIYEDVWMWRGWGPQLFGKVRFLLIHTKTDDLEDSEGESLNISFSDACLFLNGIHGINLICQQGG